MTGYTAQLFHQNRCPFLKDCQTGLALEENVFDEFVSYMATQTPKEEAITITPSIPKDHQCEIGLYPLCLVSYFQVVEVGGDEIVIGAKHVVLPREDADKPEFAKFRPAVPNWRWKEVERE